MQEQAGAGGRATVALALGLAIVAGGLVGAEVGGPPFWKWSDPNSWLVAVALGLFVALFAVPFVARNVKRSRGDEAVTWGSAMLIWLAVAISVAVLGGLLVAAAGVGSDSLAGITGIVMICEAAAVALLVAVQLLARG